MSFEKEIAKLTLERKRSVNQIAKSWGSSKLILSPETPRPEHDRPGLTGSQLIARLLVSARELQGRVVGRNNDDATFICKGLDVLAKEWELLEHSLQKAEQGLMQAERAGGETLRSAGLSSPESSDSQYVAKQHRRIQQLEDQEGRLQEEIKQVKAKWEAVMAKTMEQQASIHRQQIQEREELVAQKEAEIEKLRQQLPDCAKPALKRDKPGAPQGEKRDKYLLAGRMILGHTLQLLGPCDENKPDKIQWYRISSRGSWHPISGATRNQYSPEPYDVGCAMGCCITPHHSSSAEAIRVSSRQPIAPSPGFEDWVEELADAGGAQFGVVVVQRNGMLHTNREICMLEIAPMHVTLRLPNAVTLQQPYTTAMQVCGARGAGDAAAQGVFLAMKAHEVYMLACETARERNACIMLLRKMAASHGVLLTGPEDVATRA